LSDNNIKEETWTIRLGKYLEYNPSPFRSSDSLVRGTIICILLLALGLYVLIVLNNILAQVFGSLIVGSTLFCYFLSIYETKLLDKHERHNLR